MTTVTSGGEFTLPRDEFTEKEMLAALRQTLTEIPQTEHGLRITAVALDGKPVQLPDGWDVDNECPDHNQH